MKVTRYTADEIVEDPSPPLPDVLAQPDGAVWVDITNPGEDDVRVLRDVFHMIDTHRDLLAGSLDLYLSVISHRLNEVMRRLTGITAIFALMAVIPGVYGMNFSRAWPSFDWPYGFVVTIVAMLALVAGMLVMFRRMKWL